MEIRQGSRQCGSQAQTQRPSWNNFYGRLGLGCVTMLNWRSETLSGRRHVVQKQVRGAKEENRLAVAVGPGLGNNAAH